MQTRTLGRTGLKVSELGLGGGGLGGIFGETTDEEAQCTIQAAADAGVTYIDVATAYGNGRAEANVGQALVGRRDAAILATKFLLRPDDLSDIPAAMERSLGESLARLRTDHIDVFQLHNMVSRETGGVTMVTVTGETRRSLSLNDVLGPGGVLEGFRRLKQSGAVRFVGVTGVGEAAAIREILQSGEIDTVQTYYNLLNRSAAIVPPAGTSLHDHGQIVPLAVSLGVGVIGIRNLAAGALTGAFDRNVDPNTLSGRDAERARNLDFLTEASGAPAAKLSQIATRFVLQEPGIATVVPGVKNMTELEDALAAVALPPLSVDAMVRLDALAAEDFGVREPTDVPQ